ncbi:MAG: acyl carrier protein [Pyrinomonadaceae bacterium]
MKDQAITDDLHTEGAASSGHGHQSHTEAEIQTWLIANIAAIVEIDPKDIDMAKPLEYYGMDSMQAMHLSGDLEEWIGRTLSPTVVWDYPTIELLARHLAAEDE